MDRPIERILGGTVWTGSGPIEADVEIDEDGSVRRIVERGAPSASEGGSGGGEATPPERVIDARGLWVLPGAVDVHVHFRDPGLVESEDFTSGSASAAVGGVTTVLDMPNTAPPVANGERLRQKKEALAGRSYVDYGLFGTLVARASTAEVGRDLAAEAEELAAEGACGIKLFLGPTTGGIEAPGWGELYRILTTWSDRGMLFTFHCEDRDVIENSREAALERSGYGALLAWRPRFGELLATEGALRLSLETGARVHIAHVALREAVDAVQRAKALGAAVSAETCPQYLLLTEADFEWARDSMKVLPLIRSSADRERLWAGLREGAIDMVATDHAPHRRSDEKKGPLDGPFGMAGVQTLLPLLLDRAVRGECRVEEVVRWTSEAPAKAYGLYPRKGSIAPGADADIVLVDPEGEWCVDEAWWRSKSRNTPFWGRRGKGLPVATLLRGRLVARRGALVGEPRGLFLTRYCRRPT